MKQPRDISPLFLSQFEVDEALPFRRHLNRLEVEIGKEDYSQLKRVELLEKPPAEENFAKMVDITSRLLEGTQNNYNRQLLKRLQTRIYLDPQHYSIYYRLPDRCLRFVANWRQKVLLRFFSTMPLADCGWQSCDKALPKFECHYMADGSGGTLLLRHSDPVLRQMQPLMTASHGPFDPHTLEVALYFLRIGKAGSAIINLGFAGREPLADDNLALLESWGVPLNPSNIDVIYPYTDEHGHPYCYKLEEHLARYVAALELTLPGLVFDVHGCVGTYSEDRRIVVGLGGLPPFRQPEQIGIMHRSEGVLYLQPNDAILKGLSLVRDLSSEIYVQFCADNHHCYNLALLGGMQLLGTEIDPHIDADSMLKDEDRAYLPNENLRWLPGAGANSLQRISAHKLNPGTQCLHVEIPTAIRRKMVLKLRSLEIEASLDASGL